MKTLALALAILTGCVAPADFVQPGDSFEEAVGKQGPCVGVQRESAAAGEVEVLLAGGFVKAVFRADECIGYRPVSTARVIRVDLDWQALPRAPVAGP